MIPPTNHATAPDRTPHDRLEAALAIAFGRVSLDDPGSVTRFPVSAPPAQETLVLGKYLLQGEIARGGMGVILRARDAVLSRDLAVKVLHEAHRGDPRVIRRFEEEARISARLQHPGIVPIHEVGRSSDGSPFMVMKLIQGRTLAQLLAERPDPRHELPRFVGIFEQVCQTLAYAHSRGVIHRDLKPSNIMVGEFGEVQVMDWGLAKAKDEGGRMKDEGSGLPPQGIDKPEQATSDSSFILHPSSLDPSPLPESFTRAGQVMGTPGYMPPEQARGEVDLINERSDVFGLGAILCEILTGLPPFQEEAPLVQSAAGNVTSARARLRQCGVEEELIDLASACLDPNPEMRPTDAGEVSRRVTAHRQSVAERLRQAELRELEVRTKATEERKRRRWMLALAASVLLAISGGAGAWQWREREERKRQDEATGRIQAMLETARSALEQQNLDSARYALEQAKGMMAAESIDPAFEARLNRLWEQYKKEIDQRWILDIFEVARRGRTKVDVIQSRYRHDEALPIYRQGFGDLGIKYKDVTAEEAARKIDEYSLWAKLAIFGALVEWVWLATDYSAPERDWVRTIADKVDRDSWRAKFRVALVKKDRQMLVALAAEADPENQPRATVSLLGDILVWNHGEYEVAEKLMRRTWERYPGDFWVNQTLGYCLARKKKPALAEAARYLTAAAALDADSPGIWVNVAWCLAMSGDGPGALLAANRAVHLQPKYAAAHMNRAVALRMTGDRAGAIAACEHAIELDPKNTNFKLNLKVMEERASDLDLAFMRVQIEPNNGEYQFQFAKMIYLLGFMIDAEQHARNAVTLLPRDVAAHLVLGKILHDLGRFDKAVAIWRKAISLDPKDGWAYVELGRTLQRQGKLQEALESMTKGYSLESRLPGKPNTPGEVTTLRRLIKLKRSLNAVVEGRANPENPLQLFLYGQTAFYLGRHADAAELQLILFENYPAIAAPTSGIRYSAGCIAALAGTDPRQEHRDPLRPVFLRKQALTWLRADLLYHRQRFENNPTQESRSLAAWLRKWTHEPDLAGVREPTNLAKLPAAEQRQWRAFWNEVETLITRIRETATRPNVKAR